MTYRDRIKCMANTGRRCRTQVIMRNGIKAGKGLRDRAERR